MESREHIWLDFVEITRTSERIDVIVLTGGYNHEIFVGFFDIEIDSLEHLYLSD